MIKKFVSYQSKTITGAALVLGAASFISRIIGLLRDRLFAHQFGAGETLDIYYAAFRIPDLLYTVLIAGALSAGFIPVFIRLWEKSEEQAWRLTNNVLHIIAISLFVCGALLYILMPLIIPILVPGFSANAIETTVHLSRIMLFSPFLLGISGIVSGVLQAKKSFFIYSLTPILYNLGIIIAAAFFVPLYGISALAYGVIAGAIMHLIIQLPTLYQYGFRYRAVCSLRDPDMRTILSLMIPRTATLAVHQANIFITTIIASTLAAGSISVFHFANNLQYVAIGIVGISFALAAFPSLSEAVSQKNMERFTDQLMRTTKQILYFIIPFSIILLLLRAQIVRLLLGSGAFDWNATIATANTIAFFSLSLFAQALIPLFIRAFYAFENTKTPLLIAFITMLFHIIGSLAFKDSLGVAGLALAFSLSSLFQIIALWYVLRRHMHNGFAENNHLSSIYKIIVAGICMGIGIQMSKSPLAQLVDMERFWGIALQATGATLCGVIIYLFLSYILKIEEFILLQKTLHRRWLKLWKVEGSISSETDGIS